VFNLDTPWEKALDPTRINIAMNRHVFVGKTDVFLRK